MANLVPIVIADLDYVLTITIVKQVLGELAPYPDLNWDILLVKEAGLVVHLFLRPIFFPILQHAFDNLFDLFSAFSLALPRG